MSDAAATLLVSRLAVATLEFLVVGILVGVLLKVFPSITPRWRRRIWFLALCKPFVSLFTGFLNGIVPLAPWVSGSLLGDIVFPAATGVDGLTETSTSAFFVHATAYAWIVISTLMLLRVWVRAVKSHQFTDDHLAKGYMLKPTSVKKLDPDLTIPPYARIIVTPEDAGPATMGVFRPSVIIPESLLPWVLRHRDPSPQERARFCQVLRHELAHLNNRDDLLTLITMVMLCFFWFHPIAHWAYRRVRLNNELCCDDDVVRSGVHPADYVDTLMSIVAGRFSSRGFVMHLLGDSTPGGVLRKRMHYVLRDKPLHEKRPILAYATVVLLLVTMPRFLGHGSYVEVLMSSGETRLMSRDELASLNPLSVDRVLTPGVVYKSAAGDVTIEPASPLDAQPIGDMLADAANPLELPSDADTPIAGPTLPDALDGEMIANVTADTSTDEAEDEVPTIEPPRSKSRGPLIPSRGLGGRSSGPAGPILPARGD